MKKKQMLATLVMLSLLQGSVYAADSQKVLIGKDQWKGFIKFNSSSQTFSKDGEKLSFEDDGKTLNVVIDSELAGYNGSMDKALGFVTKDLNINFNVDNGGKGLSFLYDREFDPDEEVKAMLDASSSTSSNEINVSLDMGGGTLNLNQGQNAVIRMRNNANSSLSVSNGSLYLCVDETSDFDKFEAAIDIDGNTKKQEKAFFRATDNIDNIDIINKADSLALDNRLAIQNRANLFLTAKDSIKIMGVDEENNQSSDRRWGIGLLNADNSTAELCAKDLVIDAETAILAQYENSNVSLKAENVLLNGNVCAYGGATVDFEKLKGKQQLVTLFSTEKDGVIAQLDESQSDDLSATVNFDTDTIINVRENAGTDYTSDYNGISAVRALSNSTVNLNDSVSQYQIYGNIIAAKGDYKGDVAGGQVNIGGTGSIVKGDALAGNTGVIDIDLNNGSYEGRVDDYQDAKLKEDTFNPLEFDETVENNGTVNMTLNNSTWNVRGQSWVTTLDGNDSTIDLTVQDGETHAIHIGTLTGSNTFRVNLNADKHEVSDMIYIGKGTDEQQTLEISNERELLNQMDVNERLRFATVAEAGGGFGDNYTVKGRGIRNVNFDIEYVDYNAKSEQNESENDSYNNAAFGEVKPGTDYVDETYGTGLESNNVYLVRTENDTPVVNPDEDLTDSGKTVINMSRANYKNAIYMDRLNKRLGEARYINGEEDQGMWVRLRHDRIGQSGDFRSMNTMYELGYDEKQDCDNGERRVGFAVDYMRGSTTYSDILGKGETKRYGLWLYDTWLGDKGHYADYVLKWGHLSNDFDIRDKESFERVTGDYSNNVFSASAEYGRKKDLGNDWYIEPQAQLQLARVTGAEYTTTTQDTKVNVDGINSLIGRAGFRLGKDMGERSTVYVKADLLHEFLGDQTITATDATGSIRETFENKGTWYDVGFGFATAMGKNSYAFMDFEKSFGNDNDETYQINAGVQWTF